MNTIDGNGLEDGLAHDLKNIQRAFRFCIHHPGGVELSLLDENGNILGITFLKWLELDELLTMIKSPDGDCIVPAYTQADLDAYSATGELPMGWKRS